MRRWDLAKDWGGTLTENSPKGKGKRGNVKFQGNYVRRRKAVFVKGRKISPFQYRGGRGKAGKERHRNGLKDENCRNA